MNINQAWVKNYLSNRRKLIRFGEKKANLETVSCGVPQGSNPGPHLFLLCVNDLQNDLNVLDYVCR